MKKKKYAIIAFVFGICVTVCSGTIVLSAQEQTEKENEKSDVYKDMGDSEEEQAYRKFLENGDNFSDIKKLSNVMYAVYDINKDKKKELIVRGRTSSDGKDEYFFYRYKDKEVKTIGSMENWQNDGEGEMYYVEKGNGVVVYLRLADRKAYSLYQVKNRIKYNFMINRQSLDVKGIDGKYHREYAYDLLDENGNSIGKNITQKDWDEFESNLVEIPFYNVKMTSDSRFSEEQINTLKKSLGVPDEENVTKFIAGDPWYWEGTGRWIVSIEMYDKDEIFLAGAAIDPDTLELQREIAPYNAERVAQDRAEKGIGEDTGESQDINNKEETDEVSENIENEPVDTIVQNAENTPFYGVWCYGSKGEEESNSYAETLKASGFDARVFVTTDWSNLNTEKFYVVTAGVYVTQDEANAALASIQSVCADAYVKYSGDFQG